MAFNDDQFNEMLAPYQAAAKRMMQPYPMLGGGGGVLSQHPMLSKILNESMMGAAFVPPPQGPEGVGGGITRALQGVLGADQFERQRQMQTLMMPYQMMMPRLQAEDIQSQVDERRAMVPYRQAQEEWMHKRDENYDSQMAARLNEKSVAGDRRIDDSGEPWHGVQDPIKGYRLQRGSDGKFEDELPAAERPSFENDKVASKLGLSGNFLGQMAIGAYKKPGENIKDWTQQDFANVAESYINLSNRAQGLRTTTVKEAEEPFARKAAIRVEERKNLLNDLKVPYNKDMEDLGALVPNNPTFRQYAKNQQDMKDRQADRLRDFTNYLKTDAPTYEDYKADRGRYAPQTPGYVGSYKPDYQGNVLPKGDNRPNPSTPPSAAPPASPSAKTPHQPTWNPKTLRYE